MKDKIKEQFKIEFDKIQSDQMYKLDKNKIKLNSDLSLKLMENIFNNLFSDLKQSIEERIKNIETNIDYLKKEGLDKSEYAKGGTKTAKHEIDYLQSLLKKLQ